MLKLRDLIRKFLVHNIFLVKFATTFIKYLSLRQLDIRSIMNVMTLHSYYRHRTTYVWR